MVIETSGLWKQYDEATALCGLDLQVPAGSIFGFLGRNGAGKTTTIKVLLGMARPTKGEARVFGLDAADANAGVSIRRRTAFVSDEKDLYDDLTVGEMIAFTRGFYPQWRDDLEQKYLRRFDLAPARSIKGLSRGARTKLALLLALCRGAELLMLDEPTSGLDPVMAEDVLQALVGHVGAEQATVFFSSHQLAEVEQVADHVAIIDRGKILIEGAIDDLRSQYQRIQLVFDAEAPAMKLTSPGMHRLRRQGRAVTVLSSAAGEALLQELRGYRPSAIDVSPVTLKEIFLESVRTED